MNKMNYTPFFIGSATSAFQVEGNNINSDTWLEERAYNSGYVDYSGDAVNHYNLFEQDIKLMSELGLKAYRFSIEWSRIEPAENCFSNSAIDHYLHVLKSCEKYNLIPIVTLHHFTSPIWFIKLGGWGNVNAPLLFQRYTAYVMEKLGKMIPFVVTINEINMPLALKNLHSKLNNIPPIGVNIDLWEPSETQNNVAKSFGIDAKNYVPFLIASTDENLEIIKKSHVLAREIIKKISPYSMVGASFALSDMQYINGGKEFAKKKWDVHFKTFLDVIKEDDFIGVQTYTREIFEAEGINVACERKTQAGYEYYPEAIQGVLEKIYIDIKIPILITENGIATEKDEERISYIKQALCSVKRSMKKGINVIGYLYWSTFDNYEWQQGYSKTFGIIAVDRNTQERTVKPSGYYLGQMAKNDDLLGTSVDY